MKITNMKKYSKKKEKNNEKLWAQATCIVFKNICGTKQFVDKI